MRGNRFFSTLLIAGLLSLSAVTLLIFHVNPKENPILGLGLFFPVSFIALVSFFSLLGFILRKIFFDARYFYLQFITSIRQGVFLALLVEFSLVFSLIGFFNWFTGVLLIFIFAILELYFSKNEAKD